MEARWTDGTPMLSMTEARKRMEELVDRVSAGEEFVIVAKGRPPVRMIPYQAPEKSEGKQS